MVASSGDAFRPSSTRRTGCRARARGGLLLASAIGVGGLGWLVLHILAGNLRKSPEHAERISDFARAVINYRGWLLVSTLPVAMLGAWMLLKPGCTERSKSSPPCRAILWAVFALSALWLFVVFGIALIVFIQFLAPLYQYHDLG